MSEPVSDRRHPARAIAAALADRAPWLLDAYRALLNPRWELANRRDFRATRRALGWLRELSEPAADAPRALFLLRREDIFDIKSSAMLAAALKLEGARPVLLANHGRVPRIRRYAAAFGLADLARRDAFPVSEQAARRIAEEVRLRLARDDDFAAVRGWTHDGHALGERVLSTLIRETLVAEPDLREPAIRRRFGEILAAVFHHYHQAEAILDALRPRWMMADETGYAVNGPLVDVAIARGIDVLETSPYLRENALLHKRMNARLGRAASTSVSAETMALLERTPWTARQDAELDEDLEARYGGSSSLQRMYQWNTRPASRSEICRDLDLDPDRPLAVVFSHVMWDASFFYGEDLFPNYGVWLEETLRAAVANPRVSWLVKTHPANAFRLAHGDVGGPVAEMEVARRAVSELPAHVRLLPPTTPISTLALYRAADAAVTVRGTPGLEMACFGKPVITGGSGHYSGFGFTLDSASAQEYLGRLARIETLLAPPDEASRIRARRYAHALFRLRPWVARSFELRLDFEEEGWHPLDRNVIPRARSLDEARRHGDLHRWAEWVVRSDAADYLAHVPGDDGP